MNYKHLFEGTILSILLIGGVGAGVVTFNNYNFYSKRPVKYYNPQASTKVLPKKMLVAPKYNHHRGFDPTSFPSDIQGVYATSTPVKDKKLSKYYDITALIRITPSDIYEQYSLTSKRLPMKKISSAAAIGTQNRAQQKVRMHQLIKQYIPKSARAIANREHLKNRIGNYNIDMTPGNVSQSGNTFHFDLKQQTMLSGYSKAKLHQILGNKKLLVIPPEEFTKIRIHADEDSNNVSINGKQFKKIKDSKAKKLLKQSDIALFFLGY